MTVADDSTAVSTAVSTADSTADSVAYTRRARRGHGRATMDDVAAAAGVTKITVSRYLREPGRVSPATAERIQSALASTGYLPNRQAGQLASGTSRMVAALIPNVGHSIFAETIQGLTEGLDGSGHELLLAVTGYSQEREESQLRALLGWAPAAIIVTGRHHSDGCLALLHQAKAAGTPVIEIWDYAPQHAASQGLAQIGFSHEAVGRAMAQHLLALGHRNLAYVDSSVAEDFRAHERGIAFVAECQSAGARVVQLKAPMGDAFDAGRAMLQPLLNLNVGAAAFANDHLASGTLLQAREQGVAVPGQLALLGFGDFPIGRQLKPALSTVKPPREAIGRAAAVAALAAIGRQDANVASEALAWQIIPRETGAA